MRDDGWKCDSPLPKASPKPARTPAKEYNRPDISRVLLGVEAEDPSFAPTPPDSSGFSRISVRIPSGSLLVPEGGSALLDCGFGAVVPMGYRVRATSLVPGLLVEVVETKRFRVNVVNLGGETILNDGQRIGSIWVESVCFFDWAKKG